MSKNLLIVIVLFTFIYGCVSNNCKQFCAENGLDNDCCPRIDSTVNPLPKPSIKNVNVFLETSESMQGYMPNSNLPTNFQVIIPTILERLNGAYAGKVNFYSVYNTSQPFQKLGLQQGRDKIFNGNFNWSGSTYIPSMLDSVMKGYLKNDNVNIFISDCIYSPENINARQTAVTETDIWKTIKPFVGKFSTSFFCFFSEFRSTRFQSKNSPYYLIVQGKPQNIHEIETVLYESIKNTKQQFKEMYLGIKYNTPFYSVLPYTETSANFIPVQSMAFHNAFVSLQDIELENTNNQIVFWVGINLSGLPKYAIEKTYLENNLQMTVNDGIIGKTEIIEMPYVNSAKDDKEIADKCTHMIQIKISGISNCVSILSMSLKCTLSKWSTALNDSVDENNREKTFRLEKIISGFEQAYCPEKAEYFFENLKISLIKK